MLRKLNPTNSYKQTRLLGDKWQEEVGGRGKGEGGQEGRGEREKKEKVPLTIRASECRAASRAYYQEDCVNRTLEAASQPAPTELTFRIRTRVGEGVAQW